MKADDQDAQKNAGEKKDKTEEEMEMLEMLSHSCDNSDRKYIEPIIEMLRDIEQDR